MVEFFAEGQPLSPCCSEKTVGGVSYTLVEEKDTSAYDCLNNCVYEQAGNQGSKFCFARGNLAVTCSGKGSHKYCGEDLTSLLEDDDGIPLTHRCCGGDVQTVNNCTGDACLTACGENTCMTFVDDIQSTEQCLDGDMDGLAGFPPS